MGPSAREVFDMSFFEQDVHVGTLKLPVTVAPTNQYIAVFSLPATSGCHCGAALSLCDREGDSLQQYRFPCGAPFFSYITIRP